MAETLRPCPFCGGEAKLVSGTRRDGEYIENCAFVRCERCGAKTYELHECVTPYEVQKCATELWNERAERTCRVERVSTPYHAGPPRCSACMMPMEPLVNYCSYCGARVVSGDD